MRFDPLIKIKKFNEDNGKALYNTFAIEFHNHEDWKYLEQPEVISEIQDLKTNNCNMFIGVFRNQITQNIDLQNWDFSKAETISDMFLNNYMFNQNVESRNLAIENKRLRKEIMLFKCYSYNYPLINFVVWTTNQFYSEQLWTKKYKITDYNWFFDFAIKYSVGRNWIHYEKSDVTNYINWDFELISQNHLEELSYVESLFFWLHIPIVMKHNLYISESSHTWFGKRLYTMKSTLMQYDGKIPLYMFKNKSIQSFKKEQMFVWIQAQTLFCSNKQYGFKNAKQN